MENISDYPKIYNLGHREIVDLFCDEVVVEEKVDGSQFSFGVYDGVLECRSKNKVLDMDEPDGMFVEAVATVKELAGVLIDGWTYRAEYLKKPKHNALFYGRVPNKHLILFDVVGFGKYKPYEQKVTMAQILGLEVVPKLAEGRFETWDELKVLLDTESILGGQKVEGIVVKNYHRAGPYSPIIMGKHVREEFREVAHKKGVKKQAPDIIEEIAKHYTLTTRYEKAVQHLKEDGVLAGDTTDIGALMKEVSKDVLDECEFEIRDMLFRWAWKGITKGIVKGLPAWYKERLAEGQFA